MKLVVIIPALNEAETIAEVIGRIPAVIEGVDSTEVVVVDDGSTDDTAARARAAGAVVMSHAGNRGVGAAFATGLDAALRRGADVIVNIDGDGQFDAADIPALIQPVLSGGYGFVTCTRFGRPDYVPEMPRMRRWGNLMLARLVNRVIWGGAVHGRLLRLPRLQPRDRAAAAPVRPVHLHAGDVHRPGRQGRQHDGGAAARAGSAGERPLARGRQPVGLRRRARAPSSCGPCGTCGR